MAALESWWSIKTGTSPLNLSEQQLVDCDKSNYGCDGGWPYQSLTYLANNGGAMLETDYPYNARNNACAYTTNTKGAVKPETTKGYFYVKPNVTATMEALDKTPLSVCLDAALLSSYSSGVIRTDNCYGGYVTHAVTMVGYGTTSDGKDFWLVKNSWGTNWGENGYFRISRDLIDDPTYGVCGILY